MYIHHLFFANDKLKKILASGKFIFCSIWKYKQLNFLTLTRNTLYKVYSLIEKQEGKHAGTNVMTYLNCFRLIRDLDGSSHNSWMQNRHHHQIFYKKNSEYVLFNNIWQPTPLSAPWTHPNCVSQIINGWVYGNPFLMSRVISDSVCESVGHRGGLSVLERKSDVLDSLLVPERRWQHQQRVEWLLCHHLLRGFKCQFLSLW